MRADQDQSITSSLNRVVGNHIRKFRRESALTQKKLAQKIGVSSSFIGALEKGIKTPSLATLERMAQVFDVPLYQFFIDDEAESRYIGDRVKALISSRPPDEREFILKTVEALIKLLRRQAKIRERK